MRYFISLVVLFQLIPIAISAQADDLTKYPLNVNNQPVWIDDRFYNGFIGAIGFAALENEDNSLNYTREIAQSIAMKNISDWLIDNSGNLQEIMLSEKFKSYRHHSMQDFLDIKVEDEWLDEKNGIFYVWLVVSKK